MKATRGVVGVRGRCLLPRPWVLVAGVALAAVAAWAGPAAAQSPGPAAMESDRYGILEYENGGLVMRSAGFGRTVRSEVTPTQCESVVKGSVVEVLADQQGFGFWVENTFCRITRVDAR